MPDPRLEALWGNDGPPDLGAVLQELTRGLPWMSSAKCGETDESGEPLYDLDLWHPEKGGSVEPAKAICAECPVREECLEYALATRQSFGVWGGMSVTERKKLRRKSVGFRKENA